MLKETGVQEILLVEDDDLAAKVHSYYLQKLGYKVRLAPTGRDALRALGYDGHDIASDAAMMQYEQGNGFQAVILDLGLPDINGAQVLSTIRKREKKTGKHLPVIIVTAHGDPNILTQCKTQLKADDGFIKPVRLLNFKQSLQRLYYKKIWKEKN